MRWTKVRKLVRESFAESARGRVDINVNNADPRGTAWAEWCKEGWITVDGEVVAHIDPHRLRKLTLSLPVIGKGDNQRHTIFIVEPRPEQKVPARAEVGTFLDFPHACWEYLHSNLNESPRSQDPFVSSLAVLNAKVGLQRLRRASTWELHPLTRAMLDFRMEAERHPRPVAGVIRTPRPRAAVPRDST